MRSRFTAAFLAAVLLTALLPSIRIGPGGPVDVQGREIQATVSHQRIVALPFESSHVALRWTGAPDAHVTIAFGESQATLGEDVEVVLDDDADGTGGEVSSGVIWTGGARFARVTTDRTIDSLKILAMDAGHGRSLALDGGGAGFGAVADAAVSMPPIISRAGWGANESLRFNSGGYELFAPHYNPLQKVIVHHTAGRNDDPDPEATIRAIYYMHAVTRGYGDIDYNFLIDWQGRIYEGRHSREYAAGEPITGEDFAGNVVRGGHARDFNDGTVGIALLGNFTNILPPSAQRTALEKLIAWKLERHGINPLGASTYTNPNLGNSKYLNNISGHRNVNATSCPGNTFYDWFGTLRQHVADRIAATTGSTVDHTAPGVISLRPMVPETSGAIAMRFGLLFKEPVTGLAAGDFKVGGTSAGWAVASVTGKASGYEVTVVPPPGALPDEGTVTLTLEDSTVRDLALNIGPGTAVTATTHYVHDDVPPTVILYQTPHRTASNADYFDWTATFSEPVLGFTKSDIHLGGPDADEWYINWLLGQDASYEFLTKQDVRLNGTFTVSLAAGAVTDLAGNPSKASTVITIKADRSAPTTNGARASLRSGTTLSGSTQRVNVAWTGTDSGPAGISTFDVARSLDGAAFQTFATGLTTTSLNTLLSLGHNYRFETRARDKAGNVGSWKAGPTLTPSLVQQTSSGISWSGVSATSSSSSFSGGSERHLAAAGAAASYTATARSLSFVTTRASNRGVVKVYVDGALAGMVDLGASSTTYRYVAFSRTWSSAGTHTIKVVAASAARVDVDAFGVLR